MSKRTNISVVLSGLSVTGVLLLLQWGEPQIDPYQVRLMYLWGVYAILAVAFNLVYGYTGQMSLAHPGLAAVGAYVWAILTLSPEQKAALYMVEPPVYPISVIQWPAAPTLLIAGGMAAIVGFAIGAPAIRLRGGYLVIATMGFSEIIRLVLCNMVSVCNGPIGLYGIPRYINLAGVWGLVAVAIFVTKRLVDSSYGRAFKSIKQDEIAAEAAGIAVSRHKIMAFVISSFFVGVGGALQAQLVGAVSPDAFTIALSTAVTTMVVLGGVGSITGSVIAAGIYTLMSEALRSVETSRVILGIRVPGIPGTRVLAFAVMLLMLILFYRQGLMGTREFSWHWVSSRLQPLLGNARRGAPNSEHSRDQ